MAVGLVVSCGSLLFNVLVARRGGPAAYGGAGALLSFGTVALFLSTGSQYAVARRAAVSNRPIGMQVLTALASTWPWAIVSGALLLVALPLNTFLHLDSSVAGILPALLAVLVFAATTTLTPLQGMLVGRQRFWVLSAVNLGATAIRLLAALVLVNGPASALTGGLLATLAGTVSIGALCLVAVHSTLGEAHRTRTPSESIDAMRLTGDGLIGAALAIAVYGVWSVPLLVARHSLPAAVAGSMASAQLLASGILFLTSPITTAYLPAVARRPSLRLIGAGFLQTLLVAGAAGLALVVAGPHVIAPLFGSSFLQAAAWLPWLAVSAIALAASSYALWMTRATLRHTRPVLFGAAAGTAATLCAAWLMRHSPVGLAISPALGALAACAVALASIVYLRRGASAAPAVTVAGQRSGLRILVVNWKDPFGPGSGGAETYILRAAQEWCRRGHNVTLLVPRSRAAVVDEVREGISLIRRGNRLTVYWHARRFIRTSAEQFDRIFESACHRPFFTAEEAASLSTVIYYHLAEEQWRREYPFPLSWIGRTILEPLWVRRLESARVVTISASTAADLNRAGVRPVAVVSPGCDVTDGDPRVGPGAAPQVLFIGRMVRTKRPMDAVEAFRALRAEFPRARLDVVGDGYLLRSLRALDEPGVRFHGRASESHKRALLRAADLMLLPATKEGWGIVAMEAAAHGVPVVSYDVAGLRDAIIDGSTGVLTRSSPSALADAGISLLRDSRRWLQMSAAGRERARGFTWESTAERLLEASYLEPLAAAGLSSPGRADEPATDGRGNGQRRSRSRRQAAGIGVAAILLLGVSTAPGAANVASVLAVLALAYAALRGAGEALRGPRPWQVANPHGGTNRWKVAAAAVALTTLISMQTWFAGGAAIAQGDMTPPGGTAWLARFMNAWTWSGSDLSGPGGFQRLLPWASVLAVVTRLGGDAVMAQRVWYTLLFMGAALGALWLLRVLGLGAVGASVGALVYVFNAYVITTVNVNPVFLCALATLPLGPAVVLSVGRGWMRLRTAAILLAMVCPLVGYVALNPPLVGMVAGVTLLTPAVAAWLGGRRAAARSLGSLVAATPGILAASAYWLVPFVMLLGTVATGRLATYQDWAWTQARATLGNAIWLNSSWAWSFRDFFPYARAYDALPLSFLKYLLPAFAFAALLLVGPRSRTPSSRWARDIGLAVLGAGVAIPVLLLSVGTNPPIGLLFDAVYRLPLGWLLREPGRFLMVAGLAYGMLAGLSAEACADAIAEIALGRVGRAVSGLKDWGGRPRRLPSARFLAGVTASAVLAVGPAYPLAVGSVVPEAQANWPSGHVRLPQSWVDMAAYLNQLGTGGSVLVLPPDDFYQMPYTWGYYGTDGFITDLFARRAIVPNDHDYSPASQELLDSVRTVSGGIQSRQWPQTERVLQALDAPLVLVRGDIDTARFKDRHITPPARLADSLDTAPGFQLLHSSGELRLYGLRHSGATERTKVPVYVDSRTPDLRVLGHLPAASALVSAAAPAGTWRVAEVPAMPAWAQKDNAVSTAVEEPPGWRWSVTRLDTGTEIPLTIGSPAGPGLQLAERPGTGGTRQLAIAVPTSANLLANADFAQGEWEPVGDCYNVGGPAALAMMRSSVLGGAAPGGGRALRLSTSADSACESRTFNNPGTPVLVSMMIRHVRGLAPRVSLWQFGPDRFATLPPVAVGASWTRYAAVVVPDAGTSRLQLFVHSDSDSAATLSVNDYADVRAVSVAESPQLALVGAPIAQAGDAAGAALAIIPEAFDARWHLSGSSRQVLVNGLFNGWLTNSAAVLHGSATYDDAPVMASALVSVLTGLAIVLMVAADLVLTLRRRRRRRRHATAGWGPRSAG
jgi:arabinofuranan 3-O-arabinosyltransferase